MTNQSNLLAASLKEMINCCQGLYELLKNDGDHFTKDHFASIDESNKKKMEIITQLTHLINKLSALYPKGFWEQIKNDAKMSSEKNELRALANQLNTEITNCNKYLEINSSIIFTNLQMLKDVWDKLIVLKSENKVYDETGNIVGT